MLLTSTRLSASSALVLLMWVSGTSGLDARPARPGSFLIHPLLAYAAPSVCQTGVNETEVTPVLEELLVWGGRQLVKTVEVITDGSVETL